MNPNPKQPSALIGAICGLILLPLTLAAQNLVVSNSSVTQSGTHYENRATGTAALTVTGSLGVYTGTDITLTGTAASGNGRYGANVTNQGTLNLTDSVINANNNGVMLGGTSALAYTGGTITTTLGGNGVTATSASTVDLRDLAVNSFGIGVSLSGTSVGTLDSVNITTQNGTGLSLGTSSTATVIGGTIASQGSGVSVSGSSVATLDNLAVVQAGSGGSGVLSNNGAQVTLNHVRVTVDGRETRALHVANDGALSATNVYVRASGMGSTGLRMDSRAEGTMTLNNVDLTVEGERSTGILLASTSTIGSATAHTLVINGGTLTASQGAAIAVNPQVADYYNLETSSNYGGNFDVTLRDMALSGTSALDVTSVRTGTWNDGTVGTVSMPTNFTLATERSTLAGDVNFLGSATSTINLTDSSTLTGNLTGSGSSVTTIAFDGSSLTGLSTLNDNAIINLTLQNNANWNMTGRSKVTTLSGTNGSIITIANVEGEDLTVSDGISGQTKLNLTLSNGVKGQQEIHVVVDETEAMNNDAFTLDNQVGTGMQTYGLDNRTDGAWLVLGGGNGGGFTGAGDAVINSAAGVGSFWFTQLDNLHKRMGELRYNTPSKGNLIENVWIRSYGQQANIHTGISGVKGFSETQYGVDLGTDKAWSLDNNNTLYTGVFAGYGGADRDFHTSYTGNTDSGYGGLYGTWINKDGWYADAVAKGQYFDTSFDGEDHGSYNSYGVGLSLELGRQFQFADGWFAEPSVQVSYLHLMNDSYSTTNGLAVDLNDSDVIQFYGGARLGRNIKLNQDGWLQPYVKVGGVEQISSGGKVRASGGEWRPTTDGARAVLGAGIVYQLDANNQLHLDYEAAFGDKYDKPWGLNFGYRHQF